MAEVIGIAASIVAFVQLADRVISLSKRYLEAIEDAPAGIRAIFVQTTSLRAILDSAAFLLVSGDNLSGGKLEELTSPGGIFDLCRDAVIDLERLLPNDFSFDGEIGRTKKWRKEVSTRLAWPFKEERARKKLVEIAHYTQSITLALPTQSVEEQRATQTLIEQMSRVLSAQDKRAINDWLEATNPSSLHERTLSLHEAGTGTWVLKTNEWTSWLAGQSRSCWINGIPGSGKSVLAAFLIKQLSDYCSSRAKCTSVFYYCYHGSNQDESTPLLKWLISQLCRRLGIVPKELVYAYEQNLAPTRTELLALLEIVLKYFETIFLTIDAIDESHPRQALLDLIKGFLTETRFGNLQVLVISRTEYDIEETFAEISVPLPMDHEFVRSDIRDYVRSYIVNSREFQRWPVALGETIENKLVDGAKGMFRWVVCQLEILRRLRTAHQVNVALETLPATLDETYSRILSGVPSSYMRILRSVLVVLCSHSVLKISRNMMISPDLSLDQLLAIVVAGEEDFGDDSEESLYDASTLRDICGCLVKVRANRSMDHRSSNRDSLSPDDANGLAGRSYLVYVAHYTVAEFILSPRSASSAASAVAYFAIRPSKLATEYGTILLTATLAHMRLPKTTLWAKHGDWLRESCISFLDYVVVETATWEESAVGNLPSLIWEFASLYDNWTDVRLSLFSQGISSDRRCHTMHTLSEFSYVNCRDPTVTPPGQSHVMRFGPRAAQEHVVTLLDDFEVSQGRKRFVAAASQPLFRALLQQLRSPGRTHSLIQELRSHYDCKACIGLGMNNSLGCLVTKALEQGADPNCTRYGKTPLQVAVELLDIFGVSILLRHGADPNVVAVHDTDLPCRDGFPEEWRDRSPLRANWSPLRLCRQGPCLLRMSQSTSGKQSPDLCSRVHKRLCDQRILGSRRAGIEGWLLQSGAADFMLGEGGMEIDLVVEPQIDEEEKGYLDSLILLSDDTRN